ncbi:MAG: hypothetical protein WA584_23415 [Pyrinomonadaceae bacterium]
MAKSKKILKKTGELGRTGLPMYAGRIYDEPLAKLTGDGWRKAVRDMRNDPVVGAILFAINMLARQVSWQIVPFSSDLEDEKNAQLAREAIFDDMEQTWQETVSESLSMLEWGWSWLEMCYKRRGGESRDKTKNSRFSDNLVGFRKWAIRGQESLFRWETDEFDEITGMTQMPAPDFRVRTIPFEKSLHFRTGSHMGNPEGRAILRTAYRPWFMRANIENIEAMAIERELNGLPVVDVPADYFKKDAPQEEKDLIYYAENLVQIVRNDEVAGIVVPAVYDENGNRTFDFRLLSSDGKREIDTSATVNRYDNRIALCVLADFIFLGSNSPNGSHALMDGKNDVFSNAMSAYLDGICDTVNRRAIPKLMKLNGRNPARSPYMTHGSVQKIKLAELGEYISKLSGAQIQFSETEANHLKRQADIPVDEKSKSASKSPKKEKKNKDEEI